MISLPRAAAPALCRDENVAYLQRIWEGETVDTWKAEVTCDDASRLTAKEQAETNLTWDTGQYAYDGSGNIKTIGANTYTYDGAGRLTAAVINGATETYKYDSFGTSSNERLPDSPRSTRERTHRVTA